MHHNATYTAEMAVALALTAAKRIIPADAALRYVHTPEHTHIRMPTHTHTHTTLTQHSTRRETGKGRKKEGGREGERKTCRPAHTDIHIEAQAYEHTDASTHTRVGAKTGLHVASQHPRETARSPCPCCSWQEKPASFWDSARWGGGLRPPCGRWA